MQFCTSFLYNIYGDYIMQEYNLIDIENLVQNLYNKFNIEIPSIEYYKLLRFYNITIEYKNDIDVLYDKYIIKNDNGYTLYIRNGINKYQEIFDIIRMLGNILLDIPYNTRNFELENIVSHFAIMYLIPRKAIKPITKLSDIIIKYRVSSSMVVERIKNIEESD